jgi:iron complex transport system permease protein
MTAILRPFRLRTPAGYVSPWVSLPVLGFALIALNLFALGIGAMPVGWREIAAMLFGSAGGDPELMGQARAVLLSIRLPRLMFTLIAGASLAVSGAALQALFRNPLADPGLLGVSSGAALGAGLVIVAGAGGDSGLLAGLGGYALPLGAFLGSLAATFAVQALSGPGAGWTPSGTLLAGIAINALAGAGIGMLSYLADDAALRNLTFWMLGSLSGATWPVIGPVAVFAIPSLAYLLVKASALNLLLLGEAPAGHLGVDVGRLRNEVIVLSALSVGAVVALSGVIGFVGLAAPHLVRLSIGPDHRTLLPGAAIMGGLLLGGADLGARTLAAPAELPIGLLTSLIGGPFFIWLLKHRGGKGAD